MDLFIKPRYQLYYSMLLSTLFWGSIPATLIPLACLYLNSFWPKLTTNAIRTNCSFFNYLIFCSSRFVNMRNYEIFYCNGKWCWPFTVYTGQWYSFQVPVNIFLEIFIMLICGIMKFFIVMANDACLQRILAHF